MKKSITKRFPGLDDVIMNYILSPIQRWILLDASLLEGKYRNWVLCKIKLFCTGELEDV